MYAIRSYYAAVPEAIADVAAPVLGLLGLTTVLISMVAKDFALYLSGNTDFTKQVRERVRSKLMELLRRGDNVITSYSIHYTKLYESTAPS